ncbi:putative secreted effector protein [Golovinomyces cichoracearum]|uniref:Putative secreted effector protein n=1 Tax=Golovinomyces cichoracearum TaxID=62708 RepID=A0A420J1R9_9PEZI|nr:putative secreted effector protein [Golovinomyces cichoracearum]
MSASVSYMSDLARSVVAGQYLLNSIIPEPPQVKFYNIRLGLGSGQNSSSALPSVVVTDKADTKFYSKFEDIDPKSAASRQAYRDVPVSFSGPRGTHKRINSLGATEVAVQTSSQSNGFSLKSIDIQGGSDALCISNIVIKGSDNQAPREEIFIPIGDLGFLCGHKWNWGSVLDGNRQRCIWLDGRSETEEKNVNSLHIDMEKMGSIFKVEKNDELSNTNLETACKFFRNGLDLLGNDFTTEASEKAEEEVLLEDITLTEIVTEDESEDESKDEIVVGQMRMEDLYEKKLIPLDQKEPLMDYQEETDSIIDDETEIVNDFENTKRMAVEALEREEIEAESELIAKQTLEKESFMEEVTAAREYLQEKSEIYTQEEISALKQVLADNELAAEEIIAEKHLAEEEILAEEELIAETDLARQALEEKNRIAENQLRSKQMYAGKLLAEKFGADVSSEERLKAEEELDKANMADVENLLFKEALAEEIFEEEISRADEELKEEKLVAEQELRENESLAEEVLLAEQEIRKNEILDEEEIVDDILEDINSPDQANDDEMISDQILYDEWNQDEQPIWYNDEQENFFEEQSPNDVDEEDFMNLQDYSDESVEGTNFEERFLSNELGEESVDQWLKEQGISEGKTNEDANEYLAKEFGQKLQINGELKKRVVFAG